MEYEKEIRQLYRIIEKRFGFTEEQVKSTLRVRELVNVRRIMALTLIENTRLHLSKIGEIMGRDHSNVSHYKGTTPVLFKMEPDFYEDFKYINSKFKSFRGDTDLQDRLNNLLEDRDNIDEEIDETRKALEIINK